MQYSPMTKKHILLLSTCQGLMLSSTSLIMATSALVGVALSPEPSLATLPLGLMYLTVMVTMIPASMLMKHFGRRVGFALGGAAGLVGGGISASGIYLDNFLLFCIGSAIFGIATGFSHYYRFAAVEMVPASFKSRAISWVLAGGLIAAFIGPNGARFTRELLPDALFAASYALVALFCVGVIIIQLFIRIPMPSSEESDGEKRPLLTIIKQPTFLVAALCSMIAYGMMNLLMTATPLAMNHRDMAFAATAIVIQWHVVGMFAPSFFTGNLIDRFGVLKVMFSGALMLAACSLVALNGQTYLHFIVGLAFLGVGWNLLYIGGTTLLTEVYRPAEKGAVQGINEFLVFSATATTALSSGYLHHRLGWETLNYYALPVIGFAALIILMLGWRTRTRRLQTV
ncbi:MAG: MFS family permease [Planctomycetota bacterium]|jgi:MFS family permease